MRQNRIWGVFPRSGPNSPCLPTNSHALRSMAPLLYLTMLKTIRHRSVKGTTSPDRMHAFSAVTHQPTDPRCCCNASHYQPLNCTADTMAVQDPPVPRSLPPSCAASSATQRRCCQQLPEPPVQGHATRTSMKICLHIGVRLQITQRSKCQCWKGRHT